MGKYLGNVKMGRVAQRGQKFLNKLKKILPPHKCPFNGKWAHKTQQAADKHRRFLYRVERSQKRDVRDLLAVYRCHRCGDWHVGHDYRPDIRMSGGRHDGEGMAGQHGPGGDVGEH